MVSGFAKSAAGGSRKSTFVVPAEASSTLWSLVSLSSFFGRDIEAKKSKVP